MKRKPIKKSTRFEVLKRDSFTCQYCGAKAPNTVLQIDHVLPVSMGGSNDLSNLVTSCQPCNSGKRDKKLSDHSALKLAKKRAEEIQKEAEQLQMMVEWHKQLSRATAGSAILDYWKSQAGVKDGPWDKQACKMSRIAKTYGFKETLSAIDESIQSYVHRRHPDPHRAWSKIEAIAKINEQSKSDPFLKPSIRLTGLAASKFSLSWATEITRSDMHEFIRSRLEEGVPESHIEQAIKTGSHLGEVVESVGFSESTKTWWE